VLRLLTGGSAEEAKAEFQILSQLHRAGYPVPEVFDLGKTGDGFGAPFIIMECIEGPSFPMRFPQSPQDDLQPLLDFIRIFRNLHTLDWRPYIDQPGIVATPEEPYVHFDHELAVFDHYFSQMDVSMLEPVLDWLKGARGHAGSARSSVIHRDFHPDNILEDGAGKLFVVDWTSAEISDYRLDLAWTLTLMLAYSGPVRWQMVRDEYERQSGGPVPELEIFEVISILRRLGVVLISMNLGAEALGMRANTVDAMKKDRIPLSRIFTRLQHLTGLELPEIEAWLTGFD
jgi:aminoglycoside phosphotransferase (APT) family kinase protein